MARSQIPVTTPTLSGVAQAGQTTADASGNHYIEGTDASGGDLILEIVSSDAGSQTVAIVANPDLTLDGLTISNKTITVAAGATRYVTGIRPRTFKQAADSNRIYINPSVSTTLKFRCYKVTAAT